MGLLVTISTKAAESALTAQDKLIPENQQTPAQKQVADARDHLLDGIAALATAEEHLATEHAVQQATLAMHSQQAAQAYMKIQGITGFAQAVSSTKGAVLNILNPPDANDAATETSTEDAPEATPTAAPEPAVEAAGSAADTHDAAATDMVSEGAPVHTTEAGS